MESKIKTAVEYCIEALNSGNDASQEVEGNDAFVVQVLREIFKSPYNGRGLGIGDLGYEGYRSSFEDMSNCFSDTIKHPLSWLNAILVLFDFANYSEDTMLRMAQKLENTPIIFNHILKHIISNFVVLGEIDRAEAYITHFRTTFIFKEEDNFDMGYLIILKYYADKGDKTHFFKYFSKSKPAINRSEVARCKEILVKKYTQNQGIEKGIALCSHKNLGTKFYIDALQAYSEKGDYEELKKVLDDYSELEKIDSESKLRVLSEAYLKAKQIGNQINDDFEMLFEKALQVDRKIRWGDAKLQDVILFNLGYANQDNKERMLRCRKAIKHNSIKRDLVIKG